MRESTRPVRGIQRNASTSSWHVRCYLPGIMGTSASRFHGQSVQPSRLVSIDSRKHVPPASKRTRIGVGDAFFDHASGRPLNARQSFQGIPAPHYEHGIQNSAEGRHYVIAPSAPGDWEEAQPSIHDRERLRDALYANDAPVDLPLKSRGKMYLVVAGLVVAFIAMLMGTFFAGGSSTVADPKAAPAQAPGPVAPDMPISR